MRLEKNRPLTEIAQLKVDFENQGGDWEKTEYFIKTTTLGEIIRIETDNKKLQDLAKLRGLS